VIRLAKDIPTNGSPTVSASFDWPGTDAEGRPLPYGRYAPFFDAEAVGYVRLLYETCSGIWILAGPDEPPKGQKPSEGAPTLPPIWPPKDKGKKKVPEDPLPPTIPPEEPREPGPEKPDITIEAPPRARAGPQGSQGRPGPDNEGACL